VSESPPVRWCGRPVSVRRARASAVCACRGVVWALVPAAVLAGHRVGAAHRRRVRTRRAKPRASGRRAEGAHRPARRRAPPAGRSVSQVRPKSVPLENAMQSRARDHGYRAVPVFVPLALVAVSISGLDVGEPRARRAMTFCTSRRDRAFTIILGPQVVRTDLRDDLRHLSCSRRAAQPAAVIRARCCSRSVLTSLGGSRSCARRSCRPRAFRNCRRMAALGRDVRAAAGAGARLRTAHRAQRGRRVVSSVVPLGTHARVGSMRCGSG